MRMEVKSFQVPRWVFPLMILAALALIPVALMLALSVAALGIVGSVVRAFLPSAAPKPMETRSFRFPEFEKSDSHTAVIDADYEVKEEHEKD